jgi:hypothetical protein
VRREAADTARAEQRDEKREGRTRNLAADYDHVHERCGYEGLKRIHAPLVLSKPGLRAR